MDDTLLDAFSALKLNVGDQSDTNDPGDGRPEAECSQMCPHDEIVARERDGLLHRLELLRPYDWDSYRSQKRASQQGARQARGGPRQTPVRPFSRKFSDASRAVKEFKRSAAGQNLTISQDIRPSAVLKQTVDYLLTDLLSRIPTELKQEPPVNQFGIFYEFAFDRLRSVRQDLVLQRSVDVNCFYILEKCIDFYIYSYYIYLHFRSMLKSKADLANLEHYFVVKLNNEHLTQCLGLLLRYYDFFEDTVWSLNRPLYEAVFFVYDLKSNTTALKRFQTLNQSQVARDVFQSPVVRVASQIMVSHRIGNYVKCLRLAARQFATHPLLSATFYISSLLQVHLRLLQVLCVAFKSPNTAIPLSALVPWFCPLSYHSGACEKYLENVCLHFGLPLESPKIDHFNCDTGDDQVVQSKKVLITKKFDVDSWQMSAELQPVGWLPRLANLYRAFQA